VTDPVFERYKEALKRGHVAVFRGRPKEALAAYQEAARLVGHRALPWVSMGAVLLQMGKVQESIAAYDEALVRSPGDRQALGGMAMALTAAGRLAEAEAVEARVETLDHEESQLRAAAAASAMDHSYGRGPERIIAMAGDAAVRGDVRSAVEGYVAAAADYQGLGNLDAALDACYRALIVAAGAPGIHLRMTRVYLQLGWGELATERLMLLDRLLQLDDDRLAREELSQIAAAHVSRLPALAAIAGPTPPPGGARRPS
jgi:tetratricopeptide (TPR) repeat protein